MENVFTIHNFRISRLTRKPKPVIGPRKYYPCMTCIIAQTNCCNGNYLCLSRQHRLETQNVYTIWYKLLLWVSNTTNLSSYPCRKLMAQVQVDSLALFWSPGCWKARTDHVFPESCLEVHIPLKMAWRPESRRLRGEFG